MRTIWLLLVNLVGVGRVGEGRGRGRGQGVYQFDFIKNTPIFTKLDKSTLSNFIS